MKLSKANIHNFRRLSDVKIDFENEDTIFVGPNNSGKTSATRAFQLFLKPTQASFQIHDFSSSEIAKIDEFGRGKQAKDFLFPTISLELWFDIDPAGVEYGRVAALIPEAAIDLEEVGVKIAYVVKDADDLMSDYFNFYPDPKTRKTLAQFLSITANLSKNFELRYFALEPKSKKQSEFEIEAKEGRRVLGSLLRVDFVEAQRNIDDRDTGRSNRLSVAFADFYKKNLEQPEVNEKANQIIEANNVSLTEHYEEHFKSLLSVIGELGVPSVNDRKLKLVSSLSPETALKGNTSLYYVDEEVSHELPEEYNGLGFKNLIYMAIQVSHFHLQWINTEKARPLCQIIFIEEPEVNLHAQVQQTFIANIYDIVKTASKNAGEENMVPQLAITTHSSHILDEADFSKIRYFKRCHLDGEPAKKTKKSASQVKSLRDFAPVRKVEGGGEEKDEDTLRFLRRYLKLTHCDLFFADAAIFVEGGVEKLLIPQMIEKETPNLKRLYLTTLEVGGAYAHRFSGLMEFIGIPYVIITDLDSVDPASNNKACIADTPGAVTSNGTIKTFFDENIVTDLYKVEEHKVETNGFICFQRPVEVGVEKMYARTFEESFVYENIKLFWSGEMSIGSEIDKAEPIAAQNKIVFERVKSSGFKKMEFALDVAGSLVDWRCPSYISNGLVWLEKKMHVAEIK